MQFVYPLFFIAFAALAIPVIIHLFNFRRYKKVWFTNVRFLAEIQQETKQQSQLKQVLILLARMLAIASIVMAFAQPYIPSNKQTEKQTGQHLVSIYLDNSWSMDAVASEGKLNEIAKNKALEIAAAYGGSDRFQLITNDFEGRHQHFVSQEEFKKLVSEVQLSPSSPTLPAIISRQNEMLAGSRLLNRDAYLISDFQRSATSFSTIKPDTSVSWFLVPLQAEKRDNLYIDTIWFNGPVHQPGQSVKLTIRIRNSGQALEKVPLKLTINQIQRGLASFSIGSNAMEEIVLSYSEKDTGIQFCTVALTDYPIVYDDKYYFAYNILPSIPVLCINGEKENSYILALFKEDSAFSFNNSRLKQTDYGSIRNYSIVILNMPSEVPSGLAEELNRYVSKGGSLVIFPPESGSTASLNEFCRSISGGGYSTQDTTRQRVAFLNLENPVFQDIFEKNTAGKTLLPDNVDLPLVTRHYRIDLGNTGKAEILMKLQNGDPFLTCFHPGKGKLYLFSSPLSETWSNFPRHLIFVPTLYKISLLSNLLSPLSYTVGTEESIDIPADSIAEKNIYKISRPGSDFEIIPGSRYLGAGVSLFPHDQIREAGFYLVQSGKKNVTGIAFNYNRRESDLRCYTVAEIENEVKRLPFKSVRILKENNTSLTRQIKQLNEGTPLWKFFIFVALFFLATEILLIRVLKV